MTDWEQLARSPLGRLLRVFGLGFGLVALERLLGEQVAEMVSISTEQVVSNLGIWPAFGFVAMPFIPLVFGAAKVQRTASRERGVVVTGDKGIGLRWFLFGMAQFMVGLVGVFWFISSFSAFGLADGGVAVAAGVIVLGLVIAVWRLRGNLPDALQGVHREPAWVARIPEWGLDAILWTWSIVGIGATWGGILRGDGIDDPSFGEYLGRVFGMTLPLFLFYVPWRLVSHLVATARCDKNRGFLSTGLEVLGISFFMTTSLLVDGIRHAPVYRALAAGDLGTLQELHAEGTDLGVVFSKRRTAMHIAALGGDDALLAWLLEQGYDPNPPDDESSRKPLHLAALHGHAEAARTLIRGGAELEARARLDRTPLHLAAHKGHGLVAAALLGSGADLHARDRLGNTPLHLLAAAEWVKDEEQRLPFAALLLELGADLEARNSRGETPAESATQVRMRRLLDGR